MRRGQDEDERRLNLSKFISLELDHAPVRIKKNITMSARNRTIVDHGDGGGLFQGRIDAGRVRWCGHKRG